MYCNEKEVCRIDIKVVKYNCMKYIIIKGASNIKQQCRKTTTTKTRGPWATSLT